MQLQRIFSSLRPSVLAARGFKRVFERADNRWLLAGVFVLYVLRSLTKGRASGRFLSSRRSTRINLADGATYRVVAKQRRSA
jgi:hypothetical protein